MATFKKNLMIKISKQVKRTFKHNRRGKRSGRVDNHCPSFKKVGPPDDIDQTSHVST